MLHTNHTVQRRRRWALLLAVMVTFHMNTESESLAMDIKGYGTAPTGLVPRYPRDSVCPALTSLYGSNSNVGVVGGRFGDAVIAPADGEILAVWETDRGRGRQWNLLISHTSKDINSSDRALSYLSEFGPFELGDVQNWSTGARVERGQKIGSVRHPEGNKKYAAGVHWEVYEVPVDSRIILNWTKNEHGADTWTNSAARRIDPLYMLSRNQRKSGAGPIDLVPFTPGNDYSDFEGFTYIFECKGPPSNN